MFQASFTTSSFLNLALASASAVDIGVNLPANSSGSSLLHEVLSDAHDNPAFAETLSHAPFPSSPSDFRSRYTDAVTQFEVARANSPQRAAIARFITDRTQGRLVYRHDEHDIPLGEFMQGSADPLPVRTTHLNPGGLQMSRTVHSGTAYPAGTLLAQIPYRNKVYEGFGILALADEFIRRHKITLGARDAMQWIANQAQSNLGRLDLWGRKFVIMGAAAELAPTRLLLEGGATVLWIDRSLPPQELFDDNGLSGTIVYPTDGVDLLTQPREIAQTIAEFAGRDPVNIGAFAYVRGKAREWRLTAAMNAIVRRLDPDIVQSFSTFISPTSPVVAQPEDLRAGLVSLAAPALWQSALQLTGLLKPNHIENVVQPLVAQQGATYLAAQYIEKILTAEVFAIYGNRPDAEERNPMTVSANVAGISRTRSLSTPIFEASFLGAPMVGIETYAPETTRALSGLLMIHDLINGNAPGSASRTYNSEGEKLAALFSEQVHGGVYAYPYALDGVITVAALLGMGRRPTLIPSIVRSFF